MFPEEIEYNRNDTVSMNIYLQTQQDHVCLPLNKNPCSDSFFKLKTEMLHFPVLGKFLLPLSRTFSSEMDQVLWDLSEVNFLTSLKTKKKELNVFNVLLL